MSIKEKPFNFSTRSEEIEANLKRYYSGFANKLGEEIAEKYFNRKVYLMGKQYSITHEDGSSEEYTNIGPSGEIKWEAPIGFYFLSQTQIDDFEQSAINRAYEQAAQVASEFADVCRAEAPYDPVVVLVGASADMIAQRIRDFINESEKQTMTQEQSAQKELNRLNDVYQNPFGCFHAQRFIWTDPTGQEACAACANELVKACEAALSRIKNNSLSFAPEIQQQLSNALALAKTLIRK